MPVLLPKGRVSRVAFFNSVTKGEWYIGVKCKGCAEPILIFSDSFKGAPGPRFCGEGQISAPCYDCGHDDQYAANDFQPMRAEKDVSSYMDKRPLPSNSPRQPLRMKYPKAFTTFGIGALEHRPECAQVIARCITYWTYVETELARLLAQILKANTDPAVAMFLSLRNARAKRDAINAAAQFTLEEKDYDLFLALMQYKDAVESARNDLAHGVFGVSSAIPNGIVWISTTDYTTRQTHFHGLGGISDEMATSLRKKQFVYEIGDLETIARDIEDLHNQIMSFIGYLWSDDQAFRARRYPQLCNEPRLKKELALLHQRRKNKTEDNPE
jgi:hypothetical protein